MQQNFCIRPRRQGSITLFLALILTLVFSLFFSLLEAARVQALSQIAKRSLWLEMESAFGEYQIGLWEDYQLLFWMAVMNHISLILLCWKEDGWSRQPWNRKEQDFFR